MKFTAMAAVGEGAGGLSRWVVLLGRCGFVRWVTCVARKCCLVLVGWRGMSSVEVGFGWWDKVTSRVLSYQRRDEGQADRWSWGESRGGGKVTWMAG